MDLGLQQNPTKIKSNAPAIKWQQIILTAVSSGQPPFLKISFPPPNHN